MVQFVRWCPRSALCPFWLSEPGVGLGRLLDLISNYATELFQMFASDLRYRGIVGVEF